MNVLSTLHWLLKTSWWERSKHSSGHFDQDYNGYAWYNEKWFSPRAFILWKAKYFWANISILWKNLPVVTLLPWGEWTHCVLPQHLGVSHQREKLSALCSQSFYHNFELLQIRQEAQREKSICRRAEWSYRETEYFDIVKQTASPI